MNNTPEDVGRPRRRIGIAPPANNQKVEEVPIVLAPNTYWREEREEATAVPLVEPAKEDTPFLEGAFPYGLMGNWPWSK